MTKITIGARGSKLSLAYVAKVKELLVKNNKDLKEKNIYFKAIKTSGDLNLNKNISEIGGKHLFCKEIEESLLKKEIDIAVHSLKDMEANENERLLIGAYLKRNDFRDVIISEKIKSISDLKKGDFITHIDHGIGIFSGLQKINNDGIIQEVIKLTYADKDILYVSIHSLHKISKFKSER